MWSKAKFVNRKFLMEEIYQQHQAEQSGVNVRENLQKYLFASFIYIYVVVDKSS